MPKAGCLILFLLFSSSTVAAQELAGHDDNQFWNDIQVTVPISKPVDLITQFTSRFGRDVTRLTEYRLSLGVAYKPQKHWTFIGGYHYIDSRNALGRWRREDRFDARVLVKYPVKEFGLTHRSIAEYRLRGPLHFWNYRAAITTDHNFAPIPRGKLYVTEEVFYDTLTDSFSRNRFSVGVSKVLSSHLTVDAYYLRQNDGIARPGNLNVIGSSWKIRL